MVIGGIVLFWVLLGNLGGMISFGYVVFFGVGVYILVVLSMKFGVLVLLGMLLGGVGVLVVVLVMLLVLCLCGLYFVLVILVYVYIFCILVIEWILMIGGLGGFFNIVCLLMVMGVDLLSKIGVYFVILLIVVVFVLVYV